MARAADITLRRFRAYLIVTLIVLAAWFTWLMTVDADRQWTGFTYLLDGEYYSQLYWLVPSAGFLIFGRVIARQFGGFSSNLGRGMWLMWAAITVWGFGNVTWFYLDTCYQWFGFLDCGTEPKEPYPSAADYFYLALVPFAVASMWNIGRIMMLGREWLLTIVYWVVAIVAIGYWAMPEGWLFFPDAYGKGVFIYSDAPRKEIIYGWTYLAGDALVASMALVLATYSARLAGGVFRKALTITAASFFLLWIADFIFTKRYADGTYGVASTSDWTEALYAGFLWLACLSWYLFGRAEWRIRTQAVAAAEAALAAHAEPLAAQLNDDSTEEA